MKTPKRLPWLARKAGISEARAEELWAEAIRYATARTGWVGTDEYFRVATQRWHELMDGEHSTACDPFDLLLRSQVHVGMLPFAFWQGYSFGIAAAWSRMVRASAERLSQGLA